MKVLSAECSSTRLRREASTVSAQPNRAQSNAHCELSAE